MIKKRKIPRLEDGQVELETRRRLACTLKLGTCPALMPAWFSHTPQATDNPAYEKKKLYDYGGQLENHNDLHKRRK
jgi:hypothetical protein